MRFFKIEIENSKILIEIKNDDYSIFNRIIYWLEKFSEYNYFPNIVILIKKITGIVKLHQNEHFGRVLYLT